LPSTTEPKLTPARKSVYALGDLTVNTALSSLSLIFATYFLTQIADLRPVLAGLVPLVGRVIDAVTDPLMGQISDRTRMRSGRRRPYFLIGALPFGLTFALLWVDPGLASQAARFAYYAAIYSSMSIAMTIVSVPYLAIQPEMTLDYDERTSLNTYRTFGSLLGIFAAIAIRPVAESFGGGSEGFAWAGLAYGVLLALPWLAVYLATFERPGFSRPQASDFWSGLREVLAHKNFRTLMALYLCGRIAMDLLGALLILYVSFWIGRSGDFELTMLCFVGAVMLSLPFWLRFSMRFEKITTFIVGSVWWGLCSLLLLFGHPGWPSAVIFAFAIVTGIGYAVVDLMPWAMLGEVIDEDDLATGQRREGIYNGAFTFMRKLGGAVGVAGVMAVLDLAGFQQGEVQPESARQAIRWISGLAPALFLAAGIAFAWRYPLDRSAHREIRQALDTRIQGVP